MEKNYLKKILLLLTLFSTCLLFSQNDSQEIHVYYGNGIEILNGSTVDFGSSIIVEFTIKNIPTTNGNPSLVLGNPEVRISGSDFMLLNRPGFNVKKDSPSTFKIRKLNTQCGSFTGSVVTIYSNAKNFPVFTFTLSYSNKPSISVLGGSPTQTVPNGQTVATSTNGTLFGTQTVGNFSTRNYIISNTGTCPLDLGALTCFGYNPLTGVQSTDFAIIVAPTPYPPTGAAASNIIQPGATSYFVIRFLPISPGTKYAIISIPSNDATKNPYTFVVSGEGYNPNVNGPGGGNPDFRLWLKANRGISVPLGVPENYANPIPVETWRDLGSTGKDASQSTLANRPYYYDNVSNNINYNPVVKFQNNATMNQFMYNTDNGYYTHETFVVVQPDVTIDGSILPMTIISGTSAAKPATLGDPYPLIAGEHTGIGFGNFTSRYADERLWFSQWQDNVGNHYSVAESAADYSIAGIVNTRNKTTTASNGVEMLFNTNLIGSATTNTTYANLGYTDTSITPNLFKGTPYNIGRNINSAVANGNLNGRVAEIISYASRVLDGNRPKIESYLAIKYGITLGVNGTSINYLDSAGNIIWNTATNAGYNYNIAGIGKDVASDLYQKQSKSSNDVNAVTIGLGVIATTNIANINEFKKDRDFLMWGSNNGTFAIAGSNTVTIASGITTTFNRINKKWKIVETKSDVDGDVGNVFVGIPETAFSGLPKAATEEYVLIVADNPNFADSDIIDVIPLKINKDVYGSPILDKQNSASYQTWYDFDGTKYFTFGVAQRKEVKELVNSTGSTTDKDFLVGEYALNLKSGTFTVGCWIRNDGASTAYRTIFGKGNELQIRLNAAHKVEASWDGVTQFTSVTAVADGKWHYVVAVYFYGAADLYIDGVKDNAVLNLQNPSPNFNRFSVGALYVDKNNIINPFLGEIDQINIWDMALTANQINYLMNQEMEKYTDGKVSGKVLPQSITKNELKAVDWSLLVAYYDFNAFYGTTVEGLTDDRNFLRIKYLNKNKQLLNTQTAPLPYETVADGEWNGTNSTMWKNGAIQTIPNAVSIVPGGLTVNGNIVKIKNNVTSVGNKTVLGLFVEGTDATTYKTLTANNNTKVQVSHYLKLDGLIDLKGRSQLVQTLNSELDVTSKGFIKRDQQGTVNKYNYNYWSSPVGPINATTNNNAYTVNAVFKNGTTTTPTNINWVSGFDGSTAPFGLARYWLYKFQNGLEYADWKRFDEIVDPILPSQGFTLKGAGAADPNNLITQNYTFVGKPYNGLINGNSVLEDNLFLVGNPYPSALDAYKFINDNINIIDGEITGELYFWQHAPENNTHFVSGYTGGYSTLTLTGGTLPAAPIGITGLGTSNKISYQYIPVGQGFFVVGKLGIVGAVPIIFNNNQRAFVKENDVDDLPAPISNTLFKMVPKKKYETAIIDHFKDNSNDVVYNNYNTKIRLGFNTANNYHRQLLIGFMDDLATDGVDRGYDGYQIDTQKNDLYFLIDNSEYTIQGVGSFDVNKSYPLGVKTDTIGNVQFVVDTAEFLPANQNIYIHDKETSIYYDITKNPATVNLSAGTYNTRFELTFQTDKALGIGENELLESMIIVYNNEIKKKLFITKNQSIDIKEVSIYNIVGQQLSTFKKLADGNTIEIPFNVQSGVYLIKIITDKGVVSKKIIKQ
ncbi:LamG-like jellyroll fold domain-containing protein [Flavobacterium xueshanense]|uniref:Por secretion system C-terminal sorting domain-containing protein n=1 Tax=Flavobacterium xueshanense TaxID=935223 RepID=A0A1I2HXF0_9FLAO|nr:LamG-like jellyroll fold domain-containing protein [Flavobacterium xueshanense]SFF34815.1 Por secretion system C-terminal sorting domain-containing protein [Flavobacterium xueshanense]